MQHRLLSSSPSTRIILCVIGWLCTTIATHFGTLRGAESTDFRQQILPLLSDRCFRCHGPDEETREADLRLDQREAATRRSSNGTLAIAPGRIEESELWHRLTTADEDARMPPASTGPPFTEQELQTIRTWIEAGAPYAKHWSFERPQTPPDSSRSSATTWSLASLDRPIEQALTEIGWKPNERADRFTLIRRVTLDLIGLPPTPAEVEAFVTDPRPDAYTRVVDRLMASPSFGERWAKVWLDLARYADSAGYAQDPPRNIWRYRDWVIDAHNQGLSFDEFTRRQLAGDLLPQPTSDDLLATAFHRNTLTNSEGGTDDEEFRTAAVVDRVNTTLEVWMGLTVGCAQCHSHKYDPISQVDYFRLYAIWNNTADADRGDEAPLHTEWTRDEQQRRTQLKQELEQLAAEKQQASETPSPDASTLASLDERIAFKQKELAQIAGISTPILRELPSDQRRTTHVMLRGNFLDKGESVEPGVLSQFHPLPTDMVADRRGLAEWLVATDNPLTARVAVNRLWEQLFGTGLVETSEDFGLQGEKPSHPALLDQLAVELMRTGWDTKRLLRTIVLSATYCQSSVTDEIKRSEDPDNRRLARGPSFRLSAEMLRDQALAIAGLLSRKMHGPSVQPPRPALGLNSAFGGSTDWETSAGEDRYRRGLYTSWRRTTPYPSFTTLDAPSREVCTIRRIRTNTPLQALVTLNDPVFIEAAQALARKTLQEHPQSRLDERLESAWFRCLARRPTVAERERLRRLYQSAQQRLSESDENARRLAREPIGDPTFAVSDQELATWTVVCNVLLNLDELLTKK